jgi:superfamily II DNA helicase RecQ
MSLDELSAISGVGAKKLESYGDHVLSVVAAP